MALSPADLADIVSGIIALQARAGDQIFIPKIHAILCEMRAQDKVLAGLAFTITGSICYSRQVESAIRSLAAQGTLKLIDGTTAIVQDTLTVRNRLRTLLPGRLYRRIVSSSARFYRRMLGRI